MAKLEFYRQQVVPNLTAPSGAGIAEAGRSRGQAIQAVKQLTSTAADMFAELDAIKAEDAFNKIREQQTTLMTDPEQGFMSKKAGDAVSADFMRKYMDDFDRTIEETYSGLQNQRQRDLFRRRADAANTQYRSALRNHVLNETENYAKMTFEATNKNEAAAAAANYKDLPSVGLSLENTRNSAIAYANRAGLKGDTQIAFINASMAAVHDAVLTSAIGDNNFAYVKDYLKTFEKGGAREGQLPAARLAQIKQQIEVSDSRDKSLKLFFELSDKGGSFNSQLKELADMYRNDKITQQDYDFTKARIDQARVDANKIETDYKNNMSGRAQDWIISNPGVSIAQMPPELYSFAKKNGILSNLVTLKNSVENNIPPSGANELYTSLIILAADKPNEFVKGFDENMGDFRIRLTPNQFAKLEATRFSLGKAGTAEARRNTVINVAAQTVKSLKADITAAGIDTTPKEGSPQAQKLADFNAALIEQIELNSELRGGDPVTLSEARKIGLGLLKEGKLLDAGMFWGDKTIRTFEVTREMREEFEFIQNEYAEIPAGDRSRLSQKILANPDLAKKLGVKRSNDGTVFNPSLQRAIELAYQAELDGNSF